MLKIRPEQVRALDASLDQKLFRSLAEHLRTHVRAPTAGLAEEVLAARVRSGVARARRRGFDDRELAAYLSLMFLVAPNFDEHPAIRTWIADRHLPSVVRVKLLEQAVMAATWDEARQAADPSAWEAE